MFYLVLLGSMWLLIPVLEHSSDFHCIPYDSIYLCWNVLLSSVPSFWLACLLPHPSILFYVTPLCSMLFSDLLSISCWLFILLTPVFLACLLLFCLPCGLFPRSLLSSLILLLSSLVVVISVFPLFPSRSIPVCDSVTEVAWLLRCGAGMLLQFFWSVEIQFINNFIPCKVHIHVVM